LRHSKPCGNAFTRRSSKTSPVIDFSDVAQGGYTYDEYIQKAGATKEEAHTYLGIAIYGTKKR
jgi:hypothetical protein